MHSFPSDVESSILAIAMTILASARLSLTYFHRRVSWSSNLKFVFMLGNSLCSGTAFVTWLPRVYLATMVKVDGRVRKVDSGWIVCLVSHNFFGTQEHWTDSIPGANYLAFDIVGDLAFG